MDRNDSVLKYEILKVLNDQIVSIKILTNSYKNFEFTTDRIHLKRNYDSEYKEIAPLVEDVEFTVHFVPPRKLPKKDTSDVTTFGLNLYDIIGFGKIVKVIIQDYVNKLYSWEHNESRNVSTDKSSI